VVRGAAEVAQPRHVEGIIVETGDLARVEVLGVGGEFKPPASISATLKPWAARRRATVMPAGPAPITQASKRRSSRSLPAVVASKIMGFAKSWSGERSGDCDGERILGAAAPR